MIQNQIQLIEAKNREVLPKPVPSPVQEENRFKSLNSSFVSSANSGDSQNNSSGSSGNENKKSVFASSYNFSQEVQKASQAAVVSKRSSVFGGIGSEFPSSFKSVA